MSTQIAMYKGNYRSFVVTIGPVNTLPDLNTVTATFTAKASLTDP
jgi:hypothetical protein